jgi:tripartite-type tricarboxylate transporter receptor subunit TctC
MRPASVGSAAATSPRPLRRSLLLSAAMLPCARFASAQPAGWPSQPIRIVVASAAGGNADVVMRLLAPELEKRLGRPLVIDNLPAASGMQGTEAVAKSLADGHTLLVGTSSQLVFNLALFEPMPFDLVGSLRGVAMINSVPLVMLVNNNDPARTMQEYVSRAKASPVRLQYGSGPRGTTTHIVGLMWARAVGAEVEHVPYKAGSEGLRDLMAGRISHQFDVAVTAIPQVQGKALRALAVTGRTRLSALPEIPTVQEQGVSGFTGYTWNSIAAPAATPQPIVDRINREVAAVLALPPIRDRLAALGSEFSSPLSPAQVDAFYASERKLWVPLVRETNKAAARDARPDRLGERTARA